MNDDLDIEGSIWRLREMAGEKEAREFVRSEFRRFLRSYGHMLDRRTRKELRRQVAEIIGRGKGYWKVGLHVYLHGLVAFQKQITRTQLDRYFESFYQPGQKETFSIADASGSRPTDGSVGRASEGAYRPTQWLRRFVECCFSPKANSLVLGPTLDDLELEYLEVLAAGRLWRARGVWLRGCWSLFAAITAYLVSSAVAQIRSRFG